MRGVITGRDVVSQSLTILREFGPAAYGRCLRSLLTGRPRTFLEAVCAPAGGAFTRGWRIVTLVAVLAVTVSAAMIIDGARTEPITCDACVQLLDVRA